jgi:SAM-dependent methyltransferase
MYNGRDFLEGTAFMVDKIKRFYGNRLSSGHSDGARAVGWANEENQTKRFSVLTQIGPLNEKHILDAGCGLGDLYAYLKQHYRDFQYLGIDITDQMIEQAHARHDEATFIVSDILYFEAQAFDYVLASGLFALKVDDHATRARRIITRMYELCREGVAFNMLHRGHHPDDETFATFDPEEIQRFCTTLTPHVELRTDYLPHDFTLYLYRETPRG